MPKVLKAARLTVTMPTTINLADYFISVEEQAALEEGPGASQAAEEEEPNPRLLAAEEAEAILRETEAMVRELLEAGKNQGEQMIEEARKEAEGIVDQARQQQELWRQEAYREGYRAGYDEGLAKAQAEYRDLLDQARQTVAEAYEEKRQIIAGCEEDILRLVMTMARKVVGMELTMNSEVVKNLVRTVIAKVCDPENVTVKVNPREIDDILEYREELIRTGKINNLQIIGDESITPGGCLVETSHGNVDGRLERRLEEVEEALLEVKSGG